MVFWMDYTQTEYRLLAQSSTPWAPPVKGETRALSSTQWPFGDKYRPSITALEAAHQVIERAKPRYDVETHDARFNPVKIERFFTNEVPIHLAEGARWIRVRAYRERGGPIFTYY